MKYILTLLFLVSTMAIPSFAETSTTPQALEVSVPEASAEGLSAEKAALDLMNDKTEKKAETAINLNAVKESEIPVNLDNHQKAAGSESPLMKIVLSFAVLGVLGCGAFFFFRKYVRTTGTQANAKQIKILTQHYLGPKKSLAIIRVAGESIFIGVTDHNISLIKELSLLDEEIPEATPKSFGKLFERQNAQNNEAAYQAQDEENKDEFSIAGIKDFVSTKMRNMRSFE